MIPTIPTSWIDLDRKLQSTGRRQTFGILPERELKSRAGPLLM